MTLRRQLRRKRAPHSVITWVWILTPCVNEKGHFPLQSPERNSAQLTLWFSLVGFKAECLTEIPGLLIHGTRRWQMSFVLSYKLWSFVSGGTRKLIHRIDNVLRHEITNFWLKNNHWWNGTFSIIFNYNVSEILIFFRDY